MHIIFDFLKYVKIYLRNNEEISKFKTISWHVHPSTILAY